MSKKEKYYFDQEAADRAVAFIETHIRHCKGDLAGQKFILEKWQKDGNIKTATCVNIDQSIARYLGRMGRVH